MDLADNLLLKKTEEDKLSLLLEKQMAQIRVLGLVSYK